MYEYLINKLPPIVLYREGSEVLLTPIEQVEVLAVSHEDLSGLSLKNRKKSKREVTANELFC